MQLDNFYLEKYDSTIPIHKTVIIELCNDRNSSPFLGDLEHHILEVNKRKKETFDLENIVYIAFYDYNPVGFISLTHQSERYEIAYGITPKFRGYHLGSLLLMEFSERIFMEFDKINELTLMISKQNTSSKKTALLAGFDKVSSAKYVQRRKWKNKHLIYYLWSFKIIKVWSVVDEKDI